MRFRKRIGTVFVREIGFFCVLATFYIVLSVYQLYLNQWLQIRWRRWMTARYLGEWLHGANHYRMQLQGDAADNPDQRIADDVKLFVERTLDIGVGLLSSVVTLASFVIILWGLSAAAPLHIFGSEFAIPGYLVWGALIYAIFGTALTQWIGSPLVSLDFQQQRFEADFRFNLVRARENSEQIALLQGEPAERQRLSERFSRVVENWYGIMSRTKRLTAFTASYSQAAVIFPYILVAPAYFADKIQLGGMMQTASAFGSVQDALSFFVSAYRTLAEWRAVVARLDGFETAIASAATLATSRLDRCRVVDRQQRHRPGAASGQAAQRNAAGLGRQLQHSRQRAHPGHRSVRRRQVDLVPRHRRHLAVRQRLDRDPCKSLADDAAAAAVSSDRIAAGCDRLSRGSKRLQFGPGQGCPDFGGPAAARVAARRRKRTGTECSRWASSSALGSHARCCTRRNICSSMRRPPRSMKPRRRRSIGSSRRNCRTTTIVSIGHRSTLEAFHQRNVVLTRDGDRFALQNQSGDPEPS